MNVRLTILLAVLAALIGSTWAIIEFTDVVSRGETRRDEPWLYHIDESDLIRIEVNYQGQEIEFARDAASHQWMITGDPSYPVFSYRWGGIPLLLSGPRVNRGLKQTIDDGGQYGLDPPESVVRVTDWGENTFEFHMGIPTPDGENQYARLVGDNALYTVPSVWADVVNRLAHEPPWGRLFDLEIAQISLIEISADDETAVYFPQGNAWFVHPGAPPVDPEQSAPAAAEWAEWLELLTAPRVDAIVETRLSNWEEERLEEYGFASPDVRMVIARRGEATLEVQLAEGPTGSDSYYARTINNSDETLYSIRKERLDGIESLASDPLISPDWEPVENVEGEDREASDEAEPSN